jgi:hypothetical protein
LSFLADDDDDCQTEEDTLTNAGVEEPADLPEPIMDVYTRRAAAVMAPARFQQSPSKHLLLLVFFPCEKTTSYIEDTQKRFRGEIHRTETKNTSATTLVMSVPLQNTHKSNTDGDQSVHE